MEKRDGLTKGLAIGGTVFVWIPILAPIFFLIAALIRTGKFLLDWLMPAELFPVALVGSLVLVWAAARARSQRGLIGWGLGTAVGMLLLGQGLASVTGLASGAIEPVGWPWALVLTSIGVFILALVVIGIGGILLVRAVFRK